MLVLFTQQPFSVEGGAALQESGDIVCLTATVP